MIISSFEISVTPTNMVANRGRDMSLFIFARPY